MLSRIDQQIRVTKTMIDAVDLNTVENPRLRKYMHNYLSMMMCICSVFLRMEQTQENEEKRADVWAYLKAKDAKLYSQLKHTLLNAGTNIPTPLGRQFGLTASLRKSSSSTNNAHSSHVYPGQMLVDVHAGLILEEFWKNRSKAA